MAIWENILQQKKKRFWIVAKKKYRFFQENLTLNWYFNAFSFKLLQNCLTCNVAFVALLNRQSTKLHVYIQCYTGQDICGESL